MAASFSRERAAERADNHSHRGLILRTGVVSFVGVAKENFGAASSLTRSLKHQRMLRIVDRPRLEFLEEALTEERVTGDMRFASNDVLNDPVADLQRPDAECSRFYL